MLHASNQYYQLLKAGMCPKLCCEIWRMDKWCMHRSGHLLLPRVADAKPSLDQILPTSFN
jgi:hypothetical protein